MLNGTPCSESFLNIYIFFSEFDDSSWEVPIILGTNSQSEWFQVNDISPEAAWIWTSDKSDLIYCRHNLYKQCAGIIL